MYPPVNRMPMRYLPALPPWMLLIALALLSAFCRPANRSKPVSAAPDSLPLSPEAMREKLRTGIDFVARGQSPDWSLEMDLDEIIRFSAATGEKINTPSVAGIPLMDVAAISYRAQTEAGTLAIIIYEQACTDGWADETVTKKVEVTLNEKRYRGCGQFTYDYRLQDIWALESINRQPISLASGQERPWLELNLKQKRVYGHTGCNSFNGLAEVQGTGIRFSRMASTLKACLDQDPGFEDRYLSSLTNRRVGYTLEPLKLHLQVSEDSLYTFRKVD
jgi:heat shock protein HslJ/uncharacterized membrane protein